VVNDLSPLKKKNAGEGPQIRLKPGTRRTLNGGVQPTGKQAVGEPGYPRGSLAGKSCARSKRLAVDAAGHQLGEGKKSKKYNLQQKTRQ